MNANFPQAPLNKGFHTRTAAQNIESDEEPIFDEKRILDLFLF